MAETSLTLPMLSQMFGDMAGAIKTPDFTEPLKICRLLLVESAMENFDEMHDPDGNPWLPLKNPRANSRGDDRPLQDTGRLRSSLTSSGADAINELSAFELRYGTNVPYGIFHQDGVDPYKVEEKTRLEKNDDGSFVQKPWVFKRKGKTVFTRRIREHTNAIPKRQFLGISPALAGRFGDVLGEWVVDQIKREMNP